MGANLRGRNMELAAIFFGWLALSLSRNRRNDSEINVKYKIIDGVVWSKDEQREIIDTG